MAQKNKGIETVWKELQTARVKSAEDRKRELELEKTFKSSASDEILKQVSESAGTEEELMQLISMLKSGEAKISIIYNDNQDVQDADGNADIFNAAPDESDDML